MNVGVEQLFTLEFNSVRDADISNRAARTCRTDRLRHRLSGANAFEHRVGTDSGGQFFNVSDALITAFSHDVVCTELAGELLPRLVPAHRDDPLRTHMLRRKHSEQTNRAVTDDRDRRAR